MRGEIKAKLEGPALGRAAMDKPHKTHRPDTIHASPNDPPPTPQADYDTRGCAALMAVVLRKMPTPEAIRMCGVPVLE
jgi:hypothetical protein